MKSKILIFFPLFFLSLIMFGQRNYVNDRFFNNSIIHKSDEDLFTSKSAWYVDSKSNNIEVEYQPMSSQRILHIRIPGGRDVADNYVVLAQNLEGLESKKYKVEWWNRMMSPNGLISVELQQYQSRVQQYRTISHKDVSKVDNFIPSNWIPYSFDVDLENVEFQEGDFFRLVFSFNTAKSNEYKKSSENKDYYIAEVSIVDLDSDIIQDGGFESWDITSWPAKPLFWETRSDGNVSFDRFRGHLLDDFAYKIEVFDPGESTIIKTKNRIKLATGKPILNFWGRADTDSLGLLICMPELQLNKTVCLQKQWVKYALPLENIKEETLSNIMFKFEYTGTYYIDQVSIEN